MLVKLDSSPKVILPPMVRHYYLLTYLKVCYVSDAQFCFNPSLANYLSMIVLFSSSLAG